MGSEYFYRVGAETATRFWINNPSGLETDVAIEAGAFNCTTNPAYCSKLLQSDPEYLEGVVDEVIQETKDDDEAADRKQITPTTPTQHQPRDAQWSDHAESQRQPPDDRRKPLRPEVYALVIRDLSPVPEQPQLAGR